MKEIEKRDVTSYTADNIIGTEEGMDVKAFFKTVPKTAEALDELRHKVRSNEMVFGRLVSTDEKVNTQLSTWMRGRSITQGAEDELNRSKRC